MLEEASEVRDRCTVDTQAVFEPGVGGAWIDQPRWTQLSDAPQPLKVRVVDNRRDARGQRDAVELWETNGSLARASVGQLWDACGDGSGSVRR